jgi:hypothetical protein
MSKGKEFDGGIEERINNLVTPAVAGSGSQTSHSNNYEHLSSSTIHKHSISDIGKQSANPAVSTVAERTGKEGAEPEKKTASSLIQSSVASPVVSKVRGYGDGNNGGNGGNGSNGGGDNGNHNNGKQIGTNPLNTALNNGMQLNATAQKDGKATVTKGLVRSVQQASESNQQEYQTVATHGMKKGYENLSLFLGVPMGYQAAYTNSQKHFESAFAYSEKYGAIHNLNERGQALADQLNSFSGSKQTYNVDMLKDQAQHIYVENAIHGDGKLRMTLDSSTGKESYRVVPTKVSLNSKIAIDKNSKKDGNQLISDIGKFSEDYAKQQDSLRILQSDAQMGASNAAAWEHLVTGNFKALDDRFDFVQRYNNNVRSMQSDNRLTRAIDDSVVRSHETISHFKGTKSQINKLRNAKDSAGNSIFSDEELEALEECVTACGYNTEVSFTRGTSIAAEQAKRRLATGALDETQSASMNAIVKARVTIKTTKAVTGEASAFGKELITNAQERSVEKLTDKLSRKDDRLTSRQLENAKKKLEKKQKKYGVTSNSELKDKMRDINQNAKKQRDKKREYRRATRGLDRKEARLAITRMKNEERMLKGRGRSARLDAKESRLIKQVNKGRIRSKKKDKIKNAVTPKFVKKAKNSVVGKAFGKLYSEIVNLKAKLISLAVKKILIPAGFAGLVLIVLSAVIAIVISLFAIFIEDNGNQDSTGKEASDIQIINEEMNGYEEEKLAGFTDDIENIVRKKYPNVAEQAGHPEGTFVGKITVRNGQVRYHKKWYDIEGYYSSFNKKTKEYTEITEEEAKARSTYYVKITVNDEEIYVQRRKTGNTTSAQNMYPEVAGDYKIIDEFGNPGQLCNCMQLISLYRYYYYYDDDTSLSDPDADNANDSTFWIDDFKEGYLKRAWDATHYITRKGVPDPNHTKKWSDTINYNDIVLRGMLEEGSGMRGQQTESGITYHASSSGCSNWGSYEYIAGYDADGNPIYATRECCFGHIDATAVIQTDTKLETILNGEKLKTRNGYITLQAMEDNGGMEILETLLGTYESGYAEGYEMYAEFEIYFGSAANMMTSEDAKKTLKKIEKAWGKPLTQKQTAVLSTGLTGCGKFTYSMDYHGNCGKGVTGGATDCSGYVSWVHNNCGAYSNTNICNTTTSWSLCTGATYNWDLRTLPPGSIIIRGAKGGASASTGASNHVVIWCGYVGGNPMVIECTSGKVNGSIYRARTDLNNYKTAVPIGSSSSW